jgi:hypothetical protein
MRRISIAGLLGFVGLVAVGLSALVNATEVWVGVAFVLMLGLLLTSVLPIVFRGRRAVGWVGFAVFGWGYFLLGNISGLGMNDQERLISDAASRWIFEKSNSHPPIPPGWTYEGTGIPLTPESAPYVDALIQRSKRSKNAEFIGYWLSILLVAEIGAILGVLLARSEVTPARNDRLDANGPSTAVPHVS